MVIALTLCLWLGVIGCSAPGGSEPRAANRPAAAHAFTDVAAQAGITHRHHKPVLDPQLENIMPWMASVGAAVAAGDFDRDGWIDLYVTDSRKGQPNYLYRNNGNGTFTDVAASAGVADVNDDNGTSMDAIWADIDNDGHDDLYVVRWGRDLLLRNLGDGTFQDITAERFRTPDGRPGTPWANGNAVVAFDYDQDGRLDLYVGNYFRDVDLWHLDTTLIMHDSFETARNAGRNFLYHQQADGTFTEVAERLGVDDTGWTLAVGSADVNNDGVPDLYSANDFGPDRLFVGDGRGRLVNVTEQAIGFDTKKGMNIDFGDFNDDGWTDMYVTNITTTEYLREGNMLWRNNGPGDDGIVSFMDVSSEAGTFNGGWGWGAKFLDYDNDGDLDLFTVNGFISGGEESYWYDLASWTVLDLDPADSRNWPTIGDRSFSGHESFRFWRNDGFESFSRVDAEIGIDSTRDGRGIACLDYDNDGDVDIFVANQGQAPHLFRNEAPADRRWLIVDLKADPATGVNADAVGTRVTVMTDDGTRFRERDGGNGYSGQSDPRLHFGLGEQSVVRLLEVRWPDGGLQYVEDVAADRIVTVEQSPDEYVDASLVAVTLPERRERPVDEARTAVPEIEPAELDRLLGEMETGLGRDPADHALAHLYRRKCADYGKHDRAVAFFKRLVERDPDDVWARMELSVAHVDKIPKCGGIAAIVCKGTQARRSLDQIDEALKRRPDMWAAHYGRGMNNLHWPRALRHTDDAIADFRRCLELQRSEGVRQPYHERTFILLGDAHAKNHDFTEARRVWQAGQNDFPASTALQDRLAISDNDDLTTFIENTRSLEQPIDTDFSFLSR